MIDAILSDRADERRGLFEEAAGIGKYKDRRKAATRRLERAEMDLQRLEDVIAEVQTKVRSLARQKGKAERYHEFRSRRLSVEVAVAGHQLDTLKDRLAGVERDLHGDLVSAEGMVAELRTAETEFERLRIEGVEAEKSRSSAAGALQSIREQLVTWERDLAVADERAAYAERRLAQIDRERGDAREQASSLASEERDLDSAKDAAGIELERVRGLAAAHALEVSEVRGRLQEVRDRLDAIEVRSRELARRGAQLEGDAEASGAQADELERRLALVADELASTSAELKQLATQGDLFSNRVEGLNEELGAASARFEDRVRELQDARAEFEAARAAEREAADAEAQLAARKAALEGLEKERQGLEPVVRAALARGDAGILGTLSDFVDASSEVTEAAEAYLGTLSDALVLRDREAVARTLRWFGSQWEGGGGLVLLSLDRVPASAADASGGLLARVRTTGEGGAWVRALLDGVELSDVSAHGRPVTESRGVVRIGDPARGSGVLERREEHRLLTTQHGVAAAKRREARVRLAAAERALHAAESNVEAARLERRGTEDEHREVSGELQAQTDLRGRMHRVRDDLARQVEGAKAARTRALEREKEAREFRTAVLEQEAALDTERRGGRTDLDAVQEEWETTRAQEARLAVEVTRLEGDSARLAERLGGVSAARVRAEERVAGLDREERELRDELAKARQVRAEGDAATERLFGERSQAEQVLRERDEALQTVAAALGASERRVREARTEERAASDRRHTLELERQELGGRIERLRERLEGEWGRPWESLVAEAVPVEGDPDALQRELEELVQALNALGPVNMLAVEEHREEQGRLDFLSTQRQDLVQARDDLRAAIREINKTATDLFVSTFEAIRENFRKTFLRLFEGGEADIWLQETEDPLESPIEIHASPRGKRTQRIDLLSGGERALTALSLLFGIYLVKPSPFCVLDGVDAPLDENNFGRFIKLLQEF
jgi:chromosome segregation protein